MIEPTHNDLQRDFGRMEGSIASVNQRLDRIEAVLERMDDRLEKIEARESERRGAWKTIAFVAGSVGAVASLLFQKLFGGG